MQIVQFYQGATLGRVEMPKVTQLAGGRAELRILGPRQDNLVTEIATQRKFLLNFSSKSVVPALHFTNSTALLLVGVRTQGAEDSYPGGVYFA